MRVPVRGPLSALPLSTLLVSAALAQNPDWQQRQPLPSPTGPHHVGTVVTHFTDSNRGTSRRLAVRPVTVQLWYPASPGTGSPTSYLHEPALLDSMIHHGYLDLTPDDMSGWADVRLSATLRAVAADSPDPNGWPVVILSHGLGVARAHYSALSEELASHGYVVLALDHPIGGFTFDRQGRVLTPGVDSLAYDGPPLPFVVRDWAGDAVFVVRMLARGPLRESSQARPTLDTARVGMLGHSLGGAAALQACRSEHLVTACADMDGHPFGDVESNGVGKPFLMLHSQPDHGNRPPARDSAEAAAREQFAQMGQDRDSLWSRIGAHNGNIPWFSVKLTGTGHLSFSDAPFLMPSLLRDVGATMSPTRVHTILSELLLDFFDHFLRGQPLRLLKPGAATFAFPAAAEDSSRGEFTDPRDGQKYPTVEIAGLTWLAMNLNYAYPGSFCHDDDEPVASARNGSDWWRRSDHAHIEVARLPSNHQS